jgi:GT2 family glycosyltransferase/tetratricopeptide (TPR) repeat protein
VIPVLNGIDDTRACLRSLELTTPEPYELLLVDNGSTDGSREYLAGWAAARRHARLVENAENRGFAAAVNQALALASGRYVVLLNNDTLLTSGWLAGLVAALDAHPGAGIAAPLTNAAASPQAVSVSYASAQELAEFAAAIAERQGKPRRVSRVVGMCLLARREVVEAIGALDERFGVGNCEDDDWCLRAQAAGFEIVIATNVFVHHHGNRTFLAERIDLAGSLERNARLFAEKWGCTREQWVVAGSSAVAPDVLASNLQLPLPSRRAVPERPRQAGPELPVGELKLEQFLAEASALALGREHLALRRAFAEAQSWTDEQRAHQAVHALCQLVLRTGPTLRPWGWVELYAAAAGALTEVLEAQPAEPVLLNAAGVLLYELTRYEVAAALFERAHALDPTLRSAATNLSCARRGGSGTRLDSPLDADCERRLFELAERAVPASGLTVALCLIVRDEERLLPFCLASASRAVDEIVVVDTGSVDRSVAIAHAFGARVIEAPWDGSFARARNAGLEQVRSDWVLYLDADERLLDGPEKIRALLGRTWREGFFLEVRNLTGERGCGTASVHPALRLFRNRPQYRFEGRVHEQVTRRMPTYLPQRFELAGVGVLHHGYLAERVAERGKSVRNLALLTREAHEAPSPYVAFNLGSEYQRLGDWQTAALYFDQAWGAVGGVPGWEAVGFGPLLALRAARARRECGRLAEARELLAFALERLPAYTDLVFELALCSLAAGEPDQARALLGRCLAQGDAPPNFAATLGAGSHLARELLDALSRPESEARAA